jgi:hypothetical protein
LYFKLVKKISNKKVFVFFSASTGGTNAKTDSVNDYDDKITVSVSTTAAQHSSGTLMSCNEQWQCALIDRSIRTTFKKEVVMYLRVRRSKSHTTRHGTARHGTARHAIDYAGCTCCQKR